MIEILLPAFIVCVILVGIHTYLGIHVLKRGVIFIDIALAQIAALGMTVAHIFHWEPSSLPSYLMALLFTSLAAFLFSIIQKEGAFQEAIIGITFIVSSAISILIADRLPHGTEHLKEILTGNILWVSWSDILKTSLIYIVVSLFHFVFREKMIQISFDPDQAQKKGLNIWKWDLLFYLSFGIVITSSVQMGGLLLVFCFLIIPALTSQLFFQEIKARILFGWVFGVVCSFIGMSLSYFFDFPTGPAIVTCFGFLFFILFFYTKFNEQNHTTS